MYSKVDNSVWNLSKGEALLIKGKPQFRNGEHEIKTNKGFVPLTFLTDKLQTVFTA